DDGRQDRRRQLCEDRQQLDDDLHDLHEDRHQSLDDRQQHREDRLCQLHEQRHQRLQRRKQPLKERLSQLNDQGEQRHYRLEKLAQELRHLLNERRQHGQRLNQELPDRLTQLGHELDDLRQNRLNRLKGREQNRVENLRHSHENRAESLNGTDQHRAQRLGEQGNRRVQRLEHLTDNGQSLAEHRGQHSEQRRQARHHSDDRVREPVNQRGQRPAELAHCLQADLHQPHERLEEGVKNLRQALHRVREHVRRRDALRHLQERVREPSKNVVQEVELRGTGLPEQQECLHALTDDGSEVRQELSGLPQDGFDLLHALGGRDNVRECLGERDQALSDLVEARLQSWEDGPQLVEDWGETLLEGLRERRFQIVDLGLQRLGGLLDPVPAQRHRASSGTGSQEEGRKTSQETRDQAKDGRRSGKDRDHDPARAADVGQPRHHAASGLAESSE